MNKPYRVMVLLCGVALFFSLISQAQAGPLSPKMASTTATAMASKRLEDKPVAEGEVQPPENDACEDALPILVDQTVTGSTIGASGTSLGSCAYSEDTADVWFSFSPPETGWYLFKMCGSDFSPTFTVFQGDCVNLEEVGCSIDYACIGYCYELNFANTYLLRAAGMYHSTGNYELTVAESEPPENDLCEDAIPLLVDQTVTGSTRCASGIAQSSCGGGEDTADVWFSFTPSNTGWYKFSLYSYEFYPALAVFQGNCDALEELWCENYCSAGFCRELVESNTYLLRVAGMYLGSGDYELTVTEGGPPENDDCEKAIPVLANQTVTGSTVCATGTSLSSCGGGQDTTDVWFSFTPPTTGWYKFSLCSADSNPTLAVFQGDCGSLEEVWCDFNNCAESCREVNASNTYLIRVAGDSCGTRNYELNITEGGPPENDTCENAIPVLVNQTVTGSMACATGAPLSSCGYGEDTADVWFSFTPPKTGW